MLTKTESCVCQERSLIGPIDSVNKKIESWSKVGCGAGRLLMLNLDHGNIQVRVLCFAYYLAIS